MLAHDIVILDSADSLPQGFPESIKTSGGTMRYLPTIQEIADKLEELHDPIILVDYHKDEDHAVEIIKEFVSFKNILEIPFLLIGENGEAFDSVLDRYFICSLSINIPQNTQEVLNALSYLSRSYPNKLEQPEEEEPESFLFDDTEAIAEEFDTTEPSGPAVSEQVFDHLADIPDKEKRLAGDELKAKLTLNHLSEMDLLPQNPRIRESVERVYKELRHWPREHVCRVNYICDRFNEVLNIPQQEREQARIAALLFPWSFTKTGSSLLRKNYLIGSSNSKLELASKLKDSAMQVMSDLGEQEVGQLIASMAKLIVGEIEPEEEGVSLCASTLTAANLIDRICFQSGYWNPRGANFLLKEARNGNLSMLHPRVLTCVVKFLSEAIANLPRIFTTTTELRNNPELKQKERENYEYEPEPNERKVSITSLQPGMKLSKPIMAYDGREILSEEVILDHDLIWRLWQLSAIRPMNTPLVVDQD